MTTSTSDIRLMKSHGTRSGARIVILIFNYMRPIKFRAWDNEEMTYFQPLFTQTVWWIHWDNRDGKIIPMQFTWLLDKNGTEIYFWDILATSNAEKTHNLWNKEDNWYTIVEAHEYELWVKFSRWYMTYDTNSIYHYKFCEVIWNIYENPELL